MLFTENEKREIWNRLKAGKSSPMDRYLAHSMKVKVGNLKNLLDEVPELHRPLFVAYRLVDRGLIRTSQQFSRITSILINANQKDSQ